jgi:hypothetical protein
MTQNQQVCIMVIEKLSDGIWPVKDMIMKHYTENVNKKPMLAIKYICGRKTLYKQISQSLAGNIGFCKRGILPPLSVIDISVMIPTC